jgi:hypothetical protein
MPGLITTDQLRGTMDSAISLASITTLTLSQAQAMRRVLKFTGTPSANATVTIPVAYAPAGQDFLLWNACGGGFTVTVIVAGGSGITLGNGKTAAAFSDGTNLVSIETDYGQAGVTVYSPTLSPVAVAANTTAEQALTVTGLAATDLILSVSKPTAQAGIGIVGWRVSGANTLALTFVNATGGSITPTASEVYKVIALRP